MHVGVSVKLDVYYTVCQRPIYYNEFWQDVSFELLTVGTGKKLRWKPPTDKFSFEPWHFGLSNNANNSSTVLATAVLWMNDISFGIILEYVVNN